MARKITGFVEVVNATNDFHFTEQYDGEWTYIPPGHRHTVSAAAAIHWFGDPTLDDKGWQMEIDRLAGRSVDAFKHIQTRALRVIGWDYPYGYSSQSIGSKPQERLMPMGTRLTEEELDAIRAQVVPAKPSAPMPDASQPMQGVPVGDYGVIS